jgi:hypothetical protein
MSDPEYGRATPFVTGQAVQIECDGRTLAGSVIFASGNGKSLMLGFDAIVDGHIGMMPVLQNDDGSYSAITTGIAVKVRPVE